MDQEWQKLLSLNAVHRFPQPLLELLKSKGCWIDLEPDAVILQQGVFDRKLFFMLEGAVEVHCGGELINVLVNSGEIFGEMSFVTGLQSSATVITQTHARFFVLDHATVESCLAGEAKAYELDLYHSLAQILAERLALTNEKARLYEVQRRELAEAKSDVLRLFDEVADHKKNETQGETLEEKLRLLMKEPWGSGQRLNSFLKDMMTFEEFELLELESLIHEMEKENIYPIFLSKIRSQLKDIRDNQTLRCA